MQKVLSWLFGFLLVGLCCSQSCRSEKGKQLPPPEIVIQESVKPSLRYVKINRDVRMRNYFSFMDSLTSNYDTASRIRLNDYLIVHANPWILFALKNTDYYNLKKEGIILFDQRKKIILHRGDSLLIPDSASVAAISDKLKSTVIDVNIPEFRLRLIQSEDTILTCFIRVGRDADKFLALADHIVDLRTPIGLGEIIRIERNPFYINPDDGKQYDSTMRDDGRYTKMPIIPWLEPSINGIRYGDMIHATTNISTLGKAFSHGCIGTSESDAWMIYYNSPLGTKVVFRYDLFIKNKKGDSVRLKDIYSLKKSLAVKS